MKLRITARAASDLDEILRYIAVHSPTAATAVAKRINAALELLRLFPLSGRESELPGLRCINTNPYPYSIFYDRSDEEIIVHAIRLGARDPSGVRRSE